MLSSLFTLSKLLHKYIGLILILFLIWMSLSGVLMNHPELISEISVPGWMVPEQYHITNWNRSALIDLEFSSKDRLVGYAAGILGVWKTSDGGRSFFEMADGLPSSDYYRKVRTLLLFEGQTDWLFAGTDGGLFARNLQEDQWRRVQLGMPGKEPVKKILLVKNQLMVFTDSHAYTSPVPPAAPDFKPVRLRLEEEEQRISLIKLFFDIHYGKAWGLAGLLVFDATGLIILFLSVSAFYTWYFPWKRRLRKKESWLLSKKTSRRLFKTLFKYHLKIGIWISAILLIIGATGLFMRPPLLVALVGGDIPAAYYPGFLPNNPWHEKIQNAVYDENEERIIIQATDGFWAAPASLAEPFRRRELNAPVFVMGATVLEPYGGNGLLIGSFAGIFHLEGSSGQPIDLLSQQKVTNISTLMPAWHMVTGYFKTPEGEEFITAHTQGLLPVGDSKLNGRFGMPEELLYEFRMPLWNYLFEIHNGRFFGEWIGNWHLLIIPLGSLLFLLITLSGIYDWIYLNVLRKHIRGLPRP